MKGALAILVVLRITGGSAFNIEYYDCGGSDTVVQQFASESVCRDRPIATNDSPTTYHLLQKTLEVISPEGYSCEEIRSVFYKTCGVWGHSKTFRAPQIEVNSQVTPEQCETWIGKYIYRTSHGTKVDLTVPGETVIPDEDIGILKLDNGKVECRGQSRVIDNTMVDNIVELSQTRIIIRPITVKSVEDTTEILQDHLILPGKCHIKKGACKTEGKTYVWSPPKDLCPLKVTKTLKLLPIPETSFLLDDNEQVIIKKGNPIASPNKCPLVDIFRTDYQDLYLSPATDSRVLFKPISNVNLIDFVNARAAYSFFKAETTLGDKTSDMGLSLCHQTFKLKQSEQVHLANGTFLTKHGDVLFISKCPKRMAKLRESEICYVDIPIEPDSYIDVNSRVLKNHSGTRPCDQPMTIKASHTWVTISKGTITRAKTPPSYPYMQDSIETFSFDKGGIYTHLELEDWRKYRQTEDFHQGIITTLGHGICSQNGVCSQNELVSSYDLSRIESFKLDPFAKINKIVTDFGIYICLAVIIIEGVKITIFLSLMGLTAIQEGIQGSLAFVYLFCCSSFSSVKKIKNRNDKIRRKKEGQCSETEMLHFAAQ